ncbi:MAG: hypothetical protein V4666_08100 [Bacteroidota bacterium]
MNLEQLLNRFQNVESRISDNNSEHERINRHLYSSGVSVGSDSEKLGTPECESGVLWELEKCLYRIEGEAGRQEEAIHVTNRIAYEERAAVCKG